MEYQWGLGLDVQDLDLDVSLGDAFLLTAIGLGAVGAAMLIAGVSIPLAVGGAVIGGATILGWGSSALISGIFLKSGELEAQKYEDQAARDREQAAQDRARYEAEQAEFKYKQEAQENYYRSLTTGSKRGIKL